MAKKEDTLFQIFGKIHNHIYANEGFSPQEAFNEFIKVLFIKLESERKTPLKVDFKISNQEYNLILDGKKSSFKQKLEQIFRNVKSDYPEIFNKSDLLNLKESTLAFIIKNLQDINFDKFDTDVKGTAFQKFIFSSLRGSRGQFLTPDPIINLAINFLKPTDKDSMIDPACGTAGFLINSIRYVRNNSKESKNFLKNIKGIEISPSVLRLAKIRMIIEGDGHSELINADSLIDFQELEYITKNDLKESFDFVLTNPPFGNQGKITNKNYLKRFQLGHVWNKDLEITNKLQNSQIPEILFIERCIYLLKKGGRLAIVLPDGILENKTASYIREYIKKKCKITAVVSLPNKTFIPHGTGFKTSVLFLQKKIDQHEEDYPIFFSIIENVGYIGNKNATPSYKLNSKGDLVLNEDLSDAIKLFNQFQKGKLIEESGLGFIRNLNELQDRFDAEFYKPDFKKLEDDLKKRGAVPLGEIVEIKSGKSDIMKNPNAEIEYVEITNVNPNTSEIASSQRMKIKDVPSRASYEIRTGEIITAVAGISTGTLKHATALVTEEFDRAICTNGFKVLIPMKIDRYYLLYYLKSNLFLSQMNKYRIGAAIPSVLEDDLKRVLVLIPNKKTIKRISSEVKEAFKMREEAKKRLENLNNYFLFK